MANSFDVLIIGSGAAGLTAALNLAEHHKVAVIAKGGLSEGSTARAQGGIAAVLEPGGRLVCVEFHPVAMIFDPQWQPKYPYFAHGEPLVWEDGVSDYVALSGEALAPSGNEAGVRDFRNPHPSYEFQWSLGEVIDALLRAGLSLRRLREYPYANGWRGFDGMREGEGRRMYPPASMPSLPLMYGLVAERPA